MCVEYQQRKVDKIQKKKDEKKDEEEAKCFGKGSCCKILTALAVLYTIQNAIN